jgi:hypothetical protein
MVGIVLAISLTFNFFLLILIVILINKYCQKCSKEKEISQAIIFKKCCRKCEKDNGVEKDKTNGNGKKKPLSRETLDI